jgi:hypothetical protein
MAGTAERDIHAASLRLPERQREALELREREQLSYEEIAAVMEVGPNSVAQLISRARINLYDDLRGTVLASVAPPSPECERALPLIAARDDGQLGASSPDAVWLDAHLAECDRCRLGEEQMREAADAYRKAPPVAAATAPARVEERSGSSSSSENAVTRPIGRVPDADRPRRRYVAIAAASGALLLILTGLALAFAGGDPSRTPTAPAAGAAGQDGKAGEHGGKAAKVGKAKRRAVEKKTATRSATAAERSAGATTSVPATTTPGAASQGSSGGGASDPASAPSGSPGKAAVQPTQQTAAPKAKSKPTPSPAPQPTASAPAPAPATEPPPTEEQPDKPGRSGEAPGKPPNRPPR